jgi:DNA-binding FadR family transcriptional regulator
MPFMWWDPTMIILIPAIIVSLWAQMKVQGAFSKYSRVMSSSGLNGAAVARQLSGLVSNENDTIKNLFEVRMLLETAAAGWAAERHTEEDLELLLQNVQFHEASVNVNSINSLGEQDRKFHVLVAKSTRNPVIIRLMKSILDLLEVSNRKTLTIEGRAQQSVEEHKDIFRAIEKRNVDEAQNAMKKHLSSVIDSLYLID